MIYVNLEDSSRIAVVDARTLQVVKTWSLAPGEGPSGLAFDAEHHRLFAASDNQLMVVVDAETGKVVTTVPIGHGVDGAAFDPGTQCVFSPNGGDSTLTVIHEDSPNAFTVVQTVPTHRGARTIALDPATHRVYLPTAEF